MLSKISIAPGEVYGTGGKRTKPDKKPRSGVILIAPGEVYGTGGKMNETQPQPQSG